MSEAQYGRSASDRYEGEQIRICHKKMRIVNANQHSYTVSGEIGGVVQEISVSVETVHSQL